MRSQLRKLGRFIGRSAEIGDVRRALDEHRFVTLVGPGGAGKTRLALEAAGDVPRFDDGVVVVELAELGDERAVDQAVARALGIRAEGRAALLAALGDRALLVVLDNCEHLATACAELVATLVEGCARVGVLATSREPLGLPGEVVWQVPPLSLTVTAGDTSDAVALFVERARAASRTFAVTDSNATCIEQICRRLDGMPLAIELAAARVRVMSPAEIVERLGRDSELLALSLRSSTARHRTLRAAIDWSWDTLAEEERALLARMAVFAGNADAASVAAVCDADVETLSRLVERSLVVVAVGEPSRYRLLEMIRQYALEKLTEMGLADAVQMRHAQHMREVCDALRPRERGSHPGEIEAHLSNARAATRFLVTEPTAERVALAASLADGLFLHWMRLGLISEGRAVAESVLVAAERVGTHVPAPLWRVAGVLAWLSGDVTAAADRLAAAVEGGDVLARSFDSQIAITEGRLEDARRAATEAASAAAAQPVFIRSMLFTNLGNARRACGELDRAERAYADSLELAEQVDNGWGRAMALRNLASVELLRANHVRAEAHLISSLHACHDIGDVWFASRGLEALAEVAAAREQFDRAAHMFGAGAALREAIGVEVLAMYRRRYDEAYAATKRALGEDALARELLRGRRMSLAEAIAEAEGRIAPVETLRITALGTTSAMRAGGVAPADWAHGKPLDLLIFLLCHGPCSREQVGLALWPDSSPAQLRNSFNVAVHRLRRALGDNARIEHVGGSYAFNRSLPYWFDVEALEAARARAAASTDRAERLEALEVAIELYAGEFLADRPSAEWMTARAEALARGHLEALVEAGALALERGEARRAARHLNAAVEVDPFAEHAHRGLALALARGGDRAAGLRHLQVVRELLARELDVAPAAATDALEARLRRGDPLEGLDFTAE